ncbi:MAG: GNAT family N-acetyltransferase [Pseudomonadota bacterium]
MSEAEIERREQGSKGSYVLSLPDGTSELSFSILSPSLVIADHTSVPDALRGQGIADRLAGAIAADARAQGFKIVPLCPFVNAWRQKNADWADVFQV